jgi:hypothetical protein
MLCLPVEVRKALERFRRPALLPLERGQKISDGCWKRGSRRIKGCFACCARVRREVRVYPWVCHHLRHSGSLHRIHRQHARNQSLAVFTEEAGDIVKAVANLPEKRRKMLVLKREAATQYGI